MLFNSIDFAIFLPIIFALYWLAKSNLKTQNTLLLGASLYFYGCWDYRFLYLLIFSTSLDYIAGIKIYEAKSLKIQKVWLWLSICMNLGLLGFFKYFNFFTDSFSDGLSLFGIKADPWTLNIILPIGISFYTFHGLSYIIDIYNNKIQPERNFINYAVFVSFFPLLVAGPIERATHLLPQIKKKREFDQAKAIDGMRQMLWGFFKKIVIADNCSPFVNPIFSNPDNFSGSTLLLGGILFTFQIYCDFSGYSDIALGTARLFGIDLLRNFAYPYFSRDIAEFWRRWHISLTTWFRDYLYIPLGGHQGGMWVKIRNTFIVFIISGFWHGANWTFILWGFLNFLYITPLIIFNKNRQHLNIVAQGRILPTLKETVSIVTTFILITFSMTLFRTESIGHALNYFSPIFSRSIFSLPEVSGLTTLIIFLGLFIIVEWIGREEHFALGILRKSNSATINYSIYIIICILILAFGNFGETEFIYFQF